MELKATGIPARGEEIGGKYRIEKVIGQGGMGAVFAARNKLTGKRVAIKWLWPEQAGSVNRERLLREAQLAGSIEHPNIVDIYDVGEHQGGLFLVMEYLPGRPLSELMLDRGRLDPHELIPLLIPVMCGVHAAHLAGVIHRDLKPENIILSEHGGVIVPKVVDFGVSKVTALSAIPDASLTRSGALVGTPHYMALEQINGSSVIDPRTDVYAFGVLLYRGLTGAYPFDGATISEIILTIGTMEAPSMRIARPELPEELDQIVLRAIARNFESRFGSLEELVSALTPFAADGADGMARPSWQGALPINAIGTHSRELLRLSTTGRDVGRNESTFRTETNRLKRRRLLIAAAVGAVMVTGATVWLRSAYGTSPESAAHSADVADKPSTLSSPSEKVGIPAPEPRAIAATKPDLDEQSPEDSEIAKRPAASSERGSKHGDDARPALKRAAAQTGRQREVSAPEPSKGSRAVIPGKRTNGISVDDF